jgi:hypothetical protein
MIFFVYRNYKINVIQKTLFKGILAAGCIVAAAITSVAAQDYVSPTKPKPAALKATTVRAWLM